MAYIDGIGSGSGDDELRRVRDRLLRINEKIKKYTTPHRTSHRHSEEEYTPSGNTAVQEVSLEEMHSKLSAINNYIRNRALGKNVKPPVFKKPERKLEKLSRQIVKEEAVPGIEEPEELAEVKPDETATLELPNITAEPKIAADVRLGVGLDLGTAYIVSSREADGKKVFVKNERNAFLSVRSDDATKELLNKLKIKYVGLQDRLYVLGAIALELADIFGREVQRSMTLGILNPSEAESIPILKLLIENILWKPREQGEICCFSIPAQPIDRDQDTIYHRGVFDGLIRSIGFEPMIVDEGYAVVLSEMEDKDFTGIGVSCGAGMVNICAAFKAVPVLSFSITRGGDWIDKSAAAVLGVPSTRVTAIKEKGLDIKNPKTREDEAIAIYYRNYIHYFLESMANVFGKSKDTPRFNGPVNIVFAGGSSMVPGFLQVVGEEMKSIDFGFPVGEISNASEPFTSVARGCLFNAVNAGKIK